MGRITFLTFLVFASAVFLIFASANTQCSGKKFERRVKEHARCRKQGGGTITNRRTNHFLSKDHDVIHDRLKNLFFKYTCDGYLTTEYEQSDIKCTLAKNLKSLQHPELKKYFHYRFRFEARRM